MSEWFGREEVPSDRWNRSNPRSAAPLTIPAPGIVEPVQHACCGPMAGDAAGSGAPNVLLAVWTTIDLERTSTGGLPAVQW